MHKVLFIMIVGILGVTAWTATGARIPSVQERLAIGIERYKVQQDQGAWWACGVQQDAQRKAQQWAQAIVQAADGDLNPWALAGIVANESNFDSCAVGKRTREWGYQHRVLRRSRRTISHTRAEVLRVVRERRRAQPRSKVDLGPGQLRYGAVYFGDIRPVLTIDPGMDLVGKELRLKRRSVGKHNRLGRLRPWGLWQGHYLKWYDHRVVWRARALGARPGEI